MLQLSIDYQRLKYLIPPTDRFCYIQRYFLLCDSFLCTTAQTVNYRTFLLVLTHRGGHKHNIIASSGNVPCGILWRRCTGPPAPPAGRGARGTWSQGCRLPLSPHLSTTSWKSLKSNCSPRAAAAPSLSSLIFSWPTWEACRCHQANPSPCRPWPGPAR